MRRFIIGFSMVKKDSDGLVYKVWFHFYWCHNHHSIPHFSYNRAQVWSIFKLPIVRYNFDARWATRGIALFKLTHLGKNLVVTSGALLGAHFKSGFHRFVHKIGQWWSANAITWHCKPMRKECARSWRTPSIGWILWRLYFKSATPCDVYLATNW